MNECPPDMGERPASGAYSCCSVNDMVVTGCSTAPNTLCVNLTDTGLGYCTNTTCMDPAMDCEPVFGSGTATVTCVDGGANQFCALDCSAGTCPDGMACRAVVFTMGGPTVNICM